jgi:dienelactone hydrolase
MKTLMAVALASLTFAAPPAADLPRPTILAAPARPLMDQRVNLTVFGLQPDAPVTLTARSVAQDGVVWRSTATFRANATGAVWPGEQAPISGSYRGVDGMGLFWSMTADATSKHGDRQSFAMTDPFRPNTTTIEVSYGAQAVASRTVERRFSWEGLRTTPVRDGIVGMLYAPADGAPHPGVLVIGGSDGGFGEPQVAMMLASHGFAALSLAYFGEKGLPATLEGVPMETFARAVQWMHRRPEIDPRFVAIYGASRGTEPALYTAATTPGVNAVVARSPSFALWGGVSANHLPGKAAWTLRGKPLPAIPNTLYPDFLFTYLKDKLTGAPVRQTPLFIEDLNRFGPTAAVEIPVEKIAGPVMLLAGKDDQIWPSALMARRVLARRRRFGSAGVDRLLIYDEVGHPIPYAYLPTRKRDGDGPFAVGGTPEGAARAQADAWPRILQFLTEAAARAR